MSQDATEIRMTPEMIAMLRENMNQRNRRWTFVNWLMSFGCGATIVTSFVGCFLLITTFLPELEAVGSQLPGLIIERLAPAAGVEISKPRMPVIVVTATPLPTLPPAPTVTPTLHPPRVRALMNSNLRSAPDLSSQEIGLIGPQSVAEIVARSQNGSWYLINQNNRLAWVSASVVQVEAPTGLGLIPVWGESLTTVAAVGDLSFERGATGLNLARQPTADPFAQFRQPTPEPTPIPENLERTFWQDTRGGFQVIQREASYLPERIRDAQYNPFDGGKFLISTPTQILEVFGDGSGHNVLLSDNEIFFRGDGRYGNPHDIIWSPREFPRQFAMVILSLNEKCLTQRDAAPCKTVAIVNYDTKEVIALEPPRGRNYHGVENVFLDMEAPRWNREGTHVMTLIHPNDPSKGQAWLYDTIGRSERAQFGVNYELDVNHDSQQFYPWINTRKSWQLGNSEREDSYYK